MEVDRFWLSICLGIGLGLLYVTASYVSNRRALRSRQNAMLIVVATMVLRLIIALALIVAVLLLLPVAPTAFLGSFFVMFVIGLVVEVWILHGSEVTES